MPGYEGISIRGTRVLAGSRVLVYEKRCQGVTH